MPKNIATAETKQRKEIPFKPKLKLEDITAGVVIVDKIMRKEIVTHSIYPDRDEPCWGYFKTLQRIEERIEETTYIGYLEGNYIYGAHVHDISEYKNEGDTNDKIFFEILDKELKEAGL